MRGQGCRDRGSTPETPGILPVGNRMITGPLRAGAGLALSTISAFKPGRKPEVQCGWTGGIYRG
jgi:hypothetical protein